MKHFQGRKNPVKAIGLCLLGAVAVAAFIIAVQTADLAMRAIGEMKQTPSPVPVMQSMLIVTPDPAAPTAVPLIKTGTEGAEVEQIQERLSELGYYDGLIDGQFGPGTKQAVTQFQRQHGLDADGVVGPQTSEWLFSGAANRAVATPTPSPTHAPTANPTQNPEMPLLVNKKYPINEGYQAPDLVRMADICSPDLVIIKYEDTLGNRTAVEALITMLKAAHADGITLWQVSAGYRTYQMQMDLFDAQVSDYMRGNNLSQKDAISATRQTVADPGTSEHHTGLAFDITVPGKSFKGTEQAIWLSSHCWDYGFVIRYEEDKQAITGFLAEPWHIRYVGTAHSIPMRNQGLCLEEYLQME